MSEEIEKYEQAWKNFQNKMAFLKKRKFEILKNISINLDKQHIKSLRKKLKDHA